MVKKEEHEVLHKVNLALSNLYILYNFLLYFFLFPSPCYRHFLLTLIISKKSYLLFYSKSYYHIFFIYRYYFIFHKIIKRIYYYIDFIIFWFFLNWFLLFLLYYFWEILFIMFKYNYIFFCIYKQKQEITIKLYQTLNY